MNPETTLPPRQLRDLALIVAATLEDRALVGPIQPLAVSYDAAGALLGVSGRTVRNWADAGHLTRCNLGEEEATPRITVESIRAYLDNRAEVRELAERRDAANYPMNTPEAAHG